MKRTIVLLWLTVLLFATGCSISLPWSSAPKPDPNAEAVFNRGMELFNNKKYAAALDQFTRIKQEFPFAPQALQAELKIGESYYLNQQYPEAITALQEFQSLHPTNENIPFVIYSLGLAHFDQFTSTDRDQKNTQLAKGYFETVVNNYPKSPYAAQAKEKLAKCNGYLAEHDFSVAFFYFQQEKYAAARDRFEEIVRRYHGTPTAVKSLFYLGESYKQEKNGVKAALAYEAIIQHYPQSKLATEAKTQLAQLEKEKHDPLAMLLMRDGRPMSAPSAQQNNSETASAAKLKNVNNLVAKTEVVYEEPGEERGIFRRVVDTINPFSSAGDRKKKEVDTKKSESEAALEALAKKKSAEKKDEPPGVMASLWNGINPFGGPSAKEATGSSKNRQLVDQIDNSLQDKGIDSKSQTAALQPPSAALPKIEEVVYPQTDTGELLGKIDSNLKKGGKEGVGELPSPPEAAQAFKDAAAAQMTAAKGAVNKAESAPSIASTGLLGSVDEKLKSKGVEPLQLDLPADAADAKGTAPKKETNKKIELEPKVPVEKGPLFLGPADLQLSEPPPTNQEPVGQDKAASPDNSQEPGVREIPKSVVRGPAQSAPPQKPTEQKKAAAGEDEEKGVLDQLKQDAESIGKVLNPFRW